MPQSPYAKLLVSVNGGSLTSGGLTVATGNTFQFSMESTVGVTSQRFEIYDYPVGFSCPAGWTTDGVTAAYFSTAVTPPPVTGGVWGKLMCKLAVNGGLSNGQASPTLVDVSTALSIPSPNLGLTDLGFFETSQFSSQKLWTAGIKAGLRIIDTALGGGGPIAGNGLQTSGLTWSVKPDAEGSIVVGAGGVKVGVLAFDSEHGNRGNGALHSVADVSHDGFMPQGMWSAVNAATASPTASTLALRDSSGGSGFAYVKAGTPGTFASAGLIRVASAASVVYSRNAANNGDILGLGFDGADMVYVGNANASGINLKSQTGLSVVDASGNNVLTATVGGSYNLGLASALWDSGVVTPSLLQAQKAGNGASAGQALLIRAQQGQNVAAGTNNSGGDVTLSGGNVGTGGTGGAQGAAHLVGQGSQIDVVAAGLQLFGGAFGAGIGSKALAWAQAGAAPASNPGAGTLYVWVDPSDGKLHSLDSSGNNYSMGPQSATTAEFNLPKMANAGALNGPSTGGSAQTQAQGIIPLVSGVKITGAEFVWKNIAAYPATINVYVITAGGTVVASGSLVINANGIYTVSWGAVTLTLGTTYYVCYYRAAATEYCYSVQPTPISVIPAVPFPNGLVLVTGFAFFIASIAGNVVPSSTAGSERYMIRGIFSS